MQIRACLHAPQSYIFLILWNKIELNSSLRGLSLFMIIDCKQSFLSSLLPLSPLQLMASRPREKEDPDNKLAKGLSRQDTWVENKHLNRSGQQG